MSAGNANFSGNLVERQERYHAFLSHHGDDKPMVRQVGEELVKRGLSCWLDEWNLVPGNPWQESIEAALGQCDTCVVFFGSGGLGPWHNEEMRLALLRRVSSPELKLRVLPVILPGGQRAKESELPGFLQGTTWVEFRRSLDEEDALHRLVCGIKGVPPGRRPGATVSKGECPYVGLKTFEPADAQLFFGRTAKIEELIDRLRNNFGSPKEERFLALIGASGSGKSSLALAGLSPSIQRGELPASANWPLIICRPGTQPWESLEIALSTNQQTALRLAALGALIRRPEDEQRRLHLTARLALDDRPVNHRLFILIDQFEEIFTLCKDEGARRQLIDNVLYATNVAGGRTIVVLTMRADFYGQCASYSGLRAAIADHQSFIGPLSEEELREAIESPAHLAGGELEPGLMELLLADMKGQVGALPFLEHALFKLWEMRDGRRLKAKAYTDMGRLAGALDAHAEEFFTKTLSVEEQSLCRQLLVDLVHPGEGAADTKKRVSLEDVAPTDAARAVLAKLADARLVTTDRDDARAVLRKPADARLVTTGRDDLSEAAQAELAHEALIGGWRRLGAWVNENRDQSRLKERLLDAAREWQRKSKNEDFLYRGVQLAAAEETVGSSVESLPGLGREFLAASLELKKRLDLREEERKQRELDAALAAERRNREVASQANVSLARYSHEGGKNAQALAHLALALRLNQKNSAAANLMSAMLSQISWPVLLVGPMCHDRAVISARFSPDGRRVVTASGDNTARLWHAFSGKPIGEPMQHGAQVYFAEFSPDGHQVVTASGDKTARLWEARNGEPKGNPMVHGARVTFAQFSSDGSRVVTCSEDRTARLWDAASGAPIGEPMGHGDRVRSAQFSPDGQKVVTASGDKTMRLWNAVSGKSIGEPMWHGATVRSAQFSPDGQRIATASEDTTARLWDALSGELIGEPMRHGATVRSAQFSPDGQRIATASEDTTARLWDAQSGKPLGEPMRHGDLVYSVEFSPDGQRVATSSDDGTARLWDAQSGKSIADPMQHSTRVTAAVFSPDGQRLATVSGDHTACLWDARRNHQIGVPMQHGGGVTCAQFSPDGQRVVTASADKTARLWEALSGKQIGEPLQHEATVTSAEFSPVCLDPDGYRVVTASLASARLWDTANGKPIGRPMRHDAKVRTVQFSPDGQRVVTASGDDTARLWDAQSGESLGEPMRHGNTVNSAQFSPNGRQVVTASQDNTARLWASANGDPTGQPMRHGASVTSAQFSPDDRWVVTTSEDNTTRLWNAVTGDPIGEPMRVGDTVAFARFSPISPDMDGQRIATVSVDTVRLWDPLSGKPIGKPIGKPMRHGARVLSVQFSPDGHLVVTASGDNKARCWDALSGKPIGDPMAHADTVTSAQFSPDGQRIVTASEDKTAQLWDFPMISEKDKPEDLQMLAELAEATSRIALQTSEEEEVQNALTSEETQARREKIAITFSKPSAELTPLQRLLKWSVSDPRNRTVSPLSHLTVAEWIENTINEGTLDGLRAAMLVDPANARLTAHLGRRLADRALRSRTDPDEARRARAEAHFQTQRAVQMVSDNEEMKKLRAEVVELLKQKD